MTPNYLWTIGDSSDAERAIVYRSGHTDRVAPHWLGSADRIADAYPDARIIVCLRDPVARAISSYYHYVSKGAISPRLSLLEAAEAQPAIREHGRYRPNLTRWLELFPREAFLFIVFEDEIQPDAGESLRRSAGHSST